LNDEVANFHFQISKQFRKMNGESCVADLEQWIGFRGTVSGCLSYCHDTNLRRVKWSARSDISTQKGKGTFTPATASEDEAGV
jgi:hypothetical protein